VWGKKQVAIDQKYQEGQENNFKCFKFQFNLVVYAQFRIWCLSEPFPFRTILRHSIVDLTNNSTTIAQPSRRMSIFRYARAPTCGTEWK
jgi:hypothetical protein